MFAAALSSAAQHFACVRQEFAFPSGTDLSNAQRLANVIKF